MSLFLETIKIVNGKRINLNGHNQRLNHTRNRHFHEIRDIDLKEKVCVPEEFKKGIVKCRVIYGRHIEQVEFEPYHFNNPRKFRLVYDNDINYNYKYLERARLREIYSKKGTADDVIIIKDGLVTDSFYANLLFSRNGEWFTPSKPLLLGTQRKKYLDLQKIKTIDIAVSEINTFEYLKIINAMTGWNMHPKVKINSKSILQ